MTRLHSVFLTNSEVEDFQTDTQTSFAIQRGCRGYISYIITELAEVSVASFRAYKLTLRSSNSWKKNTINQRAAIKVLPLVPIS